ncbi:hypothetical protein Tco_1241028, partial [Tanacetum coccineum]
MLLEKKFEAQCDSQLLQEKITKASSTNSFNTVSTPVNTASASRTFSPIGPSSGPSFVPFGGSFPIDVANLPHDPLMPELDDTVEIRSTGIFCNAYDDHDLETLNNPYTDQSVGAEADFNNMEPSTVVSPIPTTRVHSTHPKAQIIEDPKSAVQTRGITKKNSGEHAMISYIQKQRRTNHKDFQNCLLLVSFLNMNPQRYLKPLMMKVGLKQCKRSCFSSRFKRGIVVRNKARLVAQGYKQEEGIDYDEMDVKSTFLYDTIEEEGIIMLDSDESGVTYMEVSSLFEGLLDIGSPRADDHEYLELPWMPEDPYAPPSPNYVPGLEHTDDEIVAEDQPDAEDASPTAQSPNYIPESDPEVDPNEDDDKDLEEDPVDYLADGGDDGDDEDEPSEEDEDDDVDIETDEDEEE